MSEEPDELIDSLFFAESQDERINRVALFFQD